MTALTYLLLLAATISIGCYLYEKLVNEENENKAIPGVPIAAFTAAISLYLFACIIRAAVAGGDELEEFKHWKREQNQTIKR